ncbi:hypothetical protein [Kistimonas asteriae]|uniref:hypothetical protein n=1 Tax=Kistimonas asteriae TaxID=517724 RepID=UPI001BAA8CB4|nr:hypothetical protein [Kistimonas asteriae]
MMRRLLFVLIATVCLAQSVVAAERQIQSISLFRADSNEVARLVKPLLSKDSIVMPYRNELVLNVTDEEFETVKALVSKLDSPPHQLMITVRTPGRKTMAGRTVGVDGVISSEGHGQGSVVISTGSSQSARRGEQTVRATEGLPAYISVGREVPVKTGMFDEDGRYRTKTDYKTAERGFYVSARVQGDRVVLDIHHADDSVRHDGESFDRRAVDTEVAGKVGEWITISSTTREGSGRTSGFNVRRYSTVDSVYEVLVKVDVVE